jgi:malonate-semialdehyde dehydrogenase (acetylating)/methylmalonate-semialdehyde dehydrogenase
LNAGIIGVNVGLSAPMAWFPLMGWSSSFVAGLYIKRTESVQFYTQQKMTMTRWFESPQESHHDPVWKTGKG